MTTLLSVTSEARGMRAPTDDEQDSAGAPRALDVGTDHPGRDAIESLYRAHYWPLVRLASYLSDPGAAEEIVQDAFVRTHGRLHRVDDDKAPGYLRVAVVNGARSHLRKRRVRRRYQQPPGGNADAAEIGGIAAAQRAELMAMLSALPQRQREVLVLRYYLDLSESEIASTLGISEGSVKTHAHRGLTALAARMEDHR